MELHCDVVAAGGDSDKEGVQREDAGQHAVPRAPQGGGRAARAAVPAGEHLQSSDI